MLESACLPDKELLDEDSRSRSPIVFNILNRSKERPVEEEKSPIIYPKFMAPLDPDVVPRVDLETRSPALKKACLTRNLGRFLFRLPKFP